MSVSGKSAFETGPSAADSTAGEWTYMPFGVVGWIKDPSGKSRVSVRAADKEMREILLRLLNSRPTSWWLAELDQYGNPKLTDGAHGDRSGVEQAAYLIQRLGLTRGRRFACAEVILTPVEAKAHGANEDALNTLNSIGLAAAAPSPTPDPLPNADET